MIHKQMVDFHYEFLRGVCPRRPFQNMIQVKKALFGSTLPDNILTWGLFGAIGYTIKVASQDIQSAALCVTFAILAPVVSKLSQSFATKFGVFLRDHLFVGHSNANCLDKKTRMVKLQDQVWQLTQHLISTALLYPCVKSFNGWNRPDLCFTPPPPVQVATLLMKICYFWEIAAYTYNGIAHRFWNARKADYYVMYAHHITTILLIAGSYSFHYWKIGIVVMFLHDFSDIPVDLLVTINMLKLADKEWFFMTEIQYVITTVSWFIVRNVLYPIKLLSPIPGFYRTENGFPDGYFMISFLSILLCVLYAMHIYWLWVFLRIGLNMLFAPVEKIEHLYESDGSKPKDAKEEKAD